MSGLFSNFVENNATGIAINSSGGSTEFQLADRRLRGYVKAVVSAPAALTAGFLLLEMQALDGTWIGAPQEVMTTASGGGTPAVIDGNNASATAIVGGRARNTTGITAVTSTLTVIFLYEPLGRPVRLRYGASGGTAVLAIEETGLTAV